MIDNVIALLADALEIEKSPVASVMSNLTRH